jgi:hypothetical protein
MEILPKRLLAAKASRANPQAHATRIRKAHLYSLHSLTTTGKHLTDSAQLLLGKTALHCSNTVPLAR